MTTWIVGTWTFSPMTTSKTSPWKRSQSTSAHFAESSLSSTTTITTKPVEGSTSSLSRRDVLATSIAVLGILGASSPSVAANEGNGITSSVDDGGVILYKLPSGLKYIELEPGKESSPTPRYGQLCIFSYKAYLKLPTDQEKQQFDSGTSYITKHGNGRILAGLDEGLHTMKPGGLRRIIIPPKLGFVESGIGPLPQYPWDRYKLNNLLEKMVEQRGGNLVYDVRLERVFDDEADQGYYEDLELSQEQLDAIQNKLVRNRSTAGQAEEA